MINDVVFYGNRDTLLQMPKINVQDIKTENWTGNCYGINFYAYCTETMSDEDINLLTTKFDLIGGNLLHERHYSRYKKVHCYIVTLLSVILCLYLKLFIKIRRF